MRGVTNITRHPKWSWLLVELILGRVHRHRHRRRWLRLGRIEHRHRRWWHPRHHRTWRHESLLRRTILLGFHLHLLVLLLHQICCFLFCRISSAPLDSILLRDKSHWASRSSTPAPASNIILHIFSCLFVVVILLLLLLSLLLLGSRFLNLEALINLLFYWLLLGLCLLRVRDFFLDWLVFRLLLRRLLLL